MGAATYYYDSMGTVHVWEGHINPHKTEREADFIMTDEQDIEAFFGSYASDLKIGEWDHVEVDDEYLGEVE